MLEIFQEKNNQQQLQKGLASCAREMPFLTNNTVSSDVKTVILKICFKRIKRYLLISELKNIEKCNVGKCKVEKCNIQNSNIKNCNAENPNKINIILVVDSIDKV